MTFSSGVIKPRPLTPHPPLLVKRRSGRRPGASSGLPCFHTPWLVFFMFVVLTLAAARPARAAEPARLQGDEVVFNYEAQTLVATGHARLAYKETVITADRLEIDMERNTLLAKGNVTFAQKDQSIKLAELSFDLDSGDAHLGPFTGEVRDEKTKGSIYLSGQDLIRTDDKTTAIDLSLTTCSLAEPHYHFTAGKIEYFPKDRLILRQVFYWEGHLRLLYLPYLAISLRERENSFQFPRFGYNNEEGLFLKLAYNFFVGDRQSGALLLDLMQRKGVGEGLKYTWEITAGTEFTASLYHLDNKLTGGDDYRVGATLSMPLGDYKFRGNLSYLEQSAAGGQWARNYQLGTQISPQKGSGPQLTMNYLSNETASHETWSLDLAASGAWRPWAGGQLSLGGRWYYAGDSLTVVSHRENYDAGFAQTWNWGRLNILLRNQVSPGYTQSLLPQVTLSVSKIDAGPILGKYKLTLDYQRREQETETLSLAGQRFAVDLDRERWLLGALGPFSLEAWAWAKERFYDSGETVRALAPELTLVTRFGSSLRVETGLSWTFAEGTPPPFFAGDAVSPRANLSMRGYFQKERWQGSLTTGYAFATGIWQPIAVNLAWSSPGGDRLTLNSSYNPQLKTLGLTSFALGWRPKQDWSFLLNTGYDPLVARWTRLDFEGNLKQSLGENLSLDLKARYDLFRETWTQSLATVNYRWHCRTLSLGYDWTRGEITLSISINAFPDYPLKLAYSDSGLGFTPPVILP